MTTASATVLEAPAGFGPDVEAEIVLSKDTFSAHVAGSGGGGASRRTPSEAS